MPATFSGNVVFQLTPSRRATNFFHAFAVCHLISTHALTEGDTFTAMPSGWNYVFQLTPSRRATDVIVEEQEFCENFNSRPHGGRPS